MNFCAKEATYSQTCYEASGANIVQVCVTLGSCGKMPTWKRSEETATDPEENRVLYAALDSF